MLISWFLTCNIRNSNLYTQYKEVTNQEANIIFAERLAEYKVL